jgi:hypothetical protein
VDLNNLVGDLRVWPTIETCHLGSSSFDLASLLDRHHWQLGRASTGFLDVPLRGGSGCAKMSRVVPPLLAWGADAAAPGASRVPLFVQAARRAAYVEYEGESG